MRREKKREWCQGSPDVYSHVLSLAADSYSKVDENSFPTGSSLFLSFIHLLLGDILPVAETEFDFRQPKELGAAKKEDGLVHIDNDFVLNPSGNSSLALKSESSPLRIFPGFTLQRRA